MNKTILFIVMLLAMSACKVSFQKARVSTVRNNVCKALRGKVVLYAVFVDSEHTHPWTEYDINSTK